MKDLIPPQFGDGERAILGGCLIDATKVPEVLNVLSTDDFYHENHRLIFEAIQRISIKRHPLDWQTLTSELQAMGRLEAIGGATYLTDLIDSVPSAANILHYVEMVKEKAVLRSLIATSREMIAKAMANDADAAKLIEESQKVAFDRITSKTGSGYQTQHVSEVLRDSIHFIEHVNTDTISSGFKSIEAITQGMLRGDLVILGGRPSMGKTAFACQVAKHVSIDEPVFIQSLEMPSKLLGVRYLAGDSGLNLRQLRSGLIGPSDWGTILDSSGRLADLNLYFNESPRATVESIYNRCRQLSIWLDKKLGLVVIDYIQLMISKGKYEKQVEKLEALTRDLKLLAREIDAPVIGLSQLNRDLEKRDLWVGGKPVGRRPHLQDLRSSGSFEQDADLIIFLYYAGYYLERDEDPRFSEWKAKAEALVAKQRNGNIGIAKLMWNAPTTTFHDPDLFHDESQYKEAV